MKVALIGTGYIAGRHAAVLAEMADIEIVGHVDVAPEAAARAAAQYGGRGYGSVAELLARETVEAAWVCVPPFAHGAVEEALIEVGVPFYVEKPVGNDLATPQRLAKAIAAKKLVVSAGYYWRCMEATAELKQLLAETPPRLIRAAWHGLTPPAPWWRVQAKSGGQMVEQATHLVDVARYLVGEATVAHAAARRFKLAAYPDADVANVTAATLEFGDVVGVFTATSVLHGTTDAVIEFYCEGRKLTLSNKGCVIEDAAGRRDRDLGRDPLAIADERFIEAVTKQDPSLVVCSYDEAVATQALCVQVLERAIVKEAK